MSQYPRPGMMPNCHGSSSDEPRLREITIMGYTLRTERYRYTIWLKFSHASKKANWREILAEELYDHFADKGENLNLAYNKDHDNVKANLRDSLMKTLEVT